MKSKLKERRERRRSKKSSQGDVELNMAAMLDMAFQLLAFFILTFRPSPIEAEVIMNMPKTAAAAGVGTTDEVTEMAEADFSLPLKVEIRASADGNIASVKLGSDEFKYSETMYNDIDARLRSLLSDFGYDKVEIHADKKLVYEPLMRVVEKCAKQRLQSGEQLSKLTISTVE